MIWSQFLHENNSLRTVPFILVYTIQCIPPYWKYSVLGFGVFFFLSTVSVECVVEPIHMLGSLSSFCLPSSSFLPCSLELVLLLFCMVPSLCYILTLRSSALYLHFYKTSSNYYCLGLRSQV